jgi:hypothetical protein
MSEDKLKNHRNAENQGEESRKRFFEWLNSNCKNAVTPEEARKITSSIKKPISKIVKE